MQKTAQKKNILRKLVDMTSGVAAEKFFNPQFKKVMEDLRKKDEEIRVPAKELKDLYKSAKSNFNKREYMQSLTELGKFHEKCMLIVQLIGELNNRVDEVHHEFLFKDLNDDHKDYLRDMKKRFAFKQNNIVKEAGIMDFLHNIFSKRGKALALWEKRYPKKHIELKKAINEILNESRSLFDVMVSSLKEMADAKFVRNVDDYVNSASKITKKYNVYDFKFREKYKIFKEYIDIATKEDAPNPLLDPKLNPIKEPVNLSPEMQTIPNVQIEPSEVETIDRKVPDLNLVPQNVKSSPVVTPEKPDTDKEQMVPSHVSEPSFNEPEIDPNLKSEQIINQFKEDDEKRRRDFLYGKKSYLDFIESLESMADESPIIVSSYIRKYADVIKETNSKAAMDLFKIANSLME